MSFINIKEQGLEQKKEQKIPRSVRGMGVIFYLISKVIV